MNANDGLQDRRADLRWLKPLRRFGGRAIAWAIALPLVSGVLVVAQAWMLAQVLHDAIVEQAGLERLGAPIAGILALMAGRAVLGALAERAAVAGAESIKHALRNRLFAALLAGATERGAGRSSGASASVMVDQVEALDGFFARFLPAMTQAAILPVAFAAALFPVDIVVALLLLATAPLVPLFMALVGWGAQAASDAQAGAMARLSGHFADRLRGLLTIRLLGRTADEAEAVNLQGEELRRRSFRVLRIAFLSSAVLEFFAALGVAGVALYIGLAYLGMVGSAGVALSLQAGLFCLLMAPEVYQPLRLLAAHYHDRANALAAVREIRLRFADLPAPVAAAPPASSVWPATGRGAAVEAQGLVVGAPDGRRLFSPLDLCLAPGDRLALLGPSGSGKTSLVDVLAGLRPAGGGVLRVDGCDVAAVDPARRANRIALIGQKPRIFHGSIADNIRFACPGASDGAVQRAAIAATVDRFAHDLPAGLGTHVGEGGFGLSGGEAHRVALARLFLRDPGLIVLDEPTAHLDPATEADVLDAIMRFAEGRTLIVATHSARVARRFDRQVDIAADGSIRLHGPAAPGHFEQKPHELGVGHCAQTRKSRLRVIARSTRAL